MNDPWAEWFSEQEIRTAAGIHRAEIVNQDTEKWLKEKALLTPVDKMYQLLGECVGGEICANCQFLFLKKPGLKGKIITWRCHHRKNKERQAAWNKESRACGGYTEKK